MRHSNCGGAVAQWQVGNFCYIQCENCEKILLEKDAEKKIRAAQGNCRNLCCQPRKLWVY